MTSERQRLISDIVTALDITKRPVFFSEMSLAVDEVLNSRTDLGDRFDEGNWNSFRFLADCRRELSRRASDIGYTAADCHLNGRPFGPMDEN